MRPFRLSRTKFIAAFVRNNDLFSTLAASRLGLKMSLFLTQAAMNFVLERRNGRKRSIYYREFRVKLGNCRWLFETENMDRFLIKWYFYYRKGVKFYMVPQKSRKKSRQALNISVKVRFPILKLAFFSSFIYCMV